MNNNSDDLGITKDNIKEVFENMKKKQEEQNLKATILYEHALEQRNGPPANFKIKKSIACFFCFLVVLIIYLLYSSSITEITNLN